MIVNRLEFQGNPEDLKKVEKLLRNKCPITKKEEVLCFCGFSKYDNSDFRFPCGKIEAFKNISFRYETNNKALIYTFNTIKDVFEPIRFLAPILYYQKLDVEVVYNIDLGEGHGGKYRFFRTSTLAQRTF